MSKKDYIKLVKILAIHDFNFKDHPIFLSDLMGWLKADNSNFCFTTFENALKDLTEKWSLNNG